MKGNCVFHQLVLFPLWACPPFSHLSWEDMSIDEIIYKSVPELWEGAISKAPEIIINHLNETLIRLCVHYSTQEGPRPTQISS